MRDRSSESTLVKVVTPQLSSGPLGANHLVKPMIKQLVSLIILFTIYSGSSAQGIVNIRATVDLTTADTFKQSGDSAGVEADSNADNTIQVCSCDLDGDGSPEHFTTQESLCGAHDCQWLITETKTNRELGEIDASVIFVTDSTRNKFSVLEAFSKCGGGCGSVGTYEFVDGSYQLIKTVSLVDEAIDKYFGSKKYLYKRN